MSDSTPLTESTTTTTTQPTASSSKPTPNPKQSSTVARSARGRPSDDDDTRHSKTLSYILRHGAAKESLSLRSDGFVRVTELMSRPKLKSCGMATLERIVKDNAKQRFTMRNEPTGPGGEEEMWIRANQGHSVVVEALELKKVERVEDVPVVVHGTYFRLWDVISKEGLISMTRNHIHCAVGLAGDDGVISGMRSNCDLFIYLDVAKILEDSVPLFTSSNNVVLTSGVEGILSPTYFKKVVRKSGEILLS